MHALDVTPMTDRSQFGAAVRSRSWEWLFALRKRLNVDLQLVDDAQTPLMTVSGSGTGREAGGETLLSGEAPGVRLAISTAIRTRTPQAASVDRLQTVVVPITLDRVVNGALLLARRTQDDKPLDKVRSELEFIGFWLTNAIEAHLQSPPPAQGDLDRLSALNQLLSDAASGGTDRDIVAAFVDTLAVWHDLEGYGYVETSRDEYVRDVALPGADPARTPAAIGRSALPEVDDVSRLAKSDIERLGFSGGEEVVLARLGKGAGSWLVAITGPIQADDSLRLGLYVSLLEQAVGLATQTAIARLLATLSNNLLIDAGSPEEQARHALSQVQTALGMTSAAFTVTSRTGAPLLHVGSSYTAADLTAGSGDGRVVIIRRDPQQYAMALVGNWDPGHRVTRQEHHVVQAAADLLESWVRRLVQHAHRAGDRRAAKRSFDDLLERTARDAVQSGIPVTAVVIGFGDAAFRPDVTQARVVSLREHLRAGDLVGRLDAGDVGVLLQDIAGAQAGALIARLRRLLERNGVPPAQVVIGMTSRNPGESITGALAQEARQRATEPASDNRP
jgi:GGDEF domain-containing protein